MVGGRSTKHYQLSGHLGVTGAAGDRAIELKYSSFVGDEFDRYGLVSFDNLIDSIRVDRKTVINFVSIIENQLDLVAFQYSDRLREEFVVAIPSQVGYSDHVDRPRTSPSFSDSSP